MKQKIVIGFSILMLLAVVFLISRDLFISSNKSSENPCEYNIDKLKQIDSSLICYKEIIQFDPGMTEIFGIAVDENKTIFITGNRKVSIFDANGTKIGEFKTDSSAQCIAVSDRDLYLGMGGHVDHYNRDGVKLNTWKTFSRKGFITSIAINGAFIYVADAGSKRLLKYSKDGNMVLDIGKKDNSKNLDGFVIPSMYFDVAFGAFNDLWVVNPGKRRVENYSLTGDLQSLWGASNMQLDGFAGCCNPAHMAILPDGNFVTYEKGLDRIKVYDPTGKFLCVVAGPGSFKGKSDFHCSQATLVNDLAADLDGNIYVLDAYNLVRIFAKKK
jgi:sugar lactone lactonase YvrE